MHYGNITTSGVIRTKGKTTTDRLRSLLEQLPVPATAPVSVVIEVPEFVFRQKNINPKSIFMLNRAIGAMQGFIATWPDTVVTEAPVRLWKGKMDKCTARLLATDIMGMDIKNHNEADAICLLDWFLRIGVK